MGLFDAFTVIKTISEAVKSACASDEAMAEIWEVIDEASAAGKLSPKLKAAYDEYVKAECETLKLQEWALYETDRAKKEELDKRIIEAQEKEGNALDVLFPILDADTTLPAEVQAKIDEAIASYNASNATVENMVSKLQ